MPAARPLGSNYGDLARALGETPRAVSGGRAARARGGEVGRAVVPGLRARARIETQRKEGRTLSNRQRGAPRGRSLGWPRSYSLRLPACDFCARAARPGRAHSALRCGWLRGGRVTHHPGHPNQQGTHDFRHPPLNFCHPAPFPAQGDPRPGGAQGLPGDADGRVPVHPGRRWTPTSSAVVQGNAPVPS